MTRTWKQLENGIHIEQVNADHPRLNIRIVQDERTMMTGMFLPDFLKEVDFALVRQYATNKALQEGVEEKEWHEEVAKRQADVNERLMERAVEEKEHAASKPEDDYSLQNRNRYLAEGMDSERNAEMKVAYYSRLAKVAGAMADFYESPSEETSK